MICNEKSTFSFISLVKSNDKYSLYDETNISRDISANIVVIKYICHRTEKSLVFGAHFSDEDSIELLSRTLKQLFCCELVFYTPAIIGNGIISGIGSFVNLCAKIPPLLCCQAICQLKNSFRSRNMKNEWLILHIAVCSDRSNACTGHVPFVLPILHSADSILSYMLRMLWISNDEYQYMQTLPLCSCTTRNRMLELIPNTVSSGGPVEIALLYPSLTAGEMVKAFRRKDCGAIETLQGTISRRYIEMGSLLYDVGHTESWKGLSPIHVVPL